MKKRFNLKCAWQSEILNARRSPCTESRRGGGGGAPCDFWRITPRDAARLKSLFGNCGVVPTRRAKNNVFADSSSSPSRTVAPEETEYSTRARLLPRHCVHTYIDIHTLVCARARRRRDLFDIPLAEEDVSLYVYEHGQERKRAFQSRPNWLRAAVFALCSLVYLSPLSLFYGLGFCISWKGDGKSRARFTFIF